MTPGPTPPVVLVDGGYYSVAVPFDFGGVRVEEPVFLVSIPPENDPVISLPFDDSVEDEYTIWGYEAVATSVVPSGVTRSGFGEYADVWVDSVIRRLSVWYGGLSSGGAEGVSGTPTVLYRF